MPSAYGERILFHISLQAKYFIIRQDYFISRSDISLRKEAPAFKVGASLLYRYLKLCQLCEEVQGDWLDLWGTGMEQLKHPFVLVASFRRRNITKNTAQITIDRRTNRLQQIDRWPHMAVFDFGEIDDCDPDALHHIFLR